MTDIKIAAIWARVSTQGQAETSLDSQVNEVKDWLEKQQYVVPDEFILRVTWSSLNLIDCPEAQHLLDLVQKEKIKAIGVFHSDRLGGNPNHKLFVLTECKRHNVQVLAKNSPLLEGKEGELVEYISTWGKEAAVIRTQLGAKVGLRDRALQRGLPPTMARPFGYEWKNNKAVLTQDADTARLILNLGQQGYTLKAIGKDLQKRGLPSPKGHLTWAPSSIRAILTNPIYAGRVATLKYERIESKSRRKNTYGKTSARLKPENEWHWLNDLVDKPLITWQQYQSIQERLKANIARASRNAHHDYLLRGLIDCQLCHRHYYGVQRTRQKPGYVCSASWSQPYGKRCQAKALSCSEVEEDVKTRIRKFIENPEHYLAESGKLAKIKADTAIDITKTIVDLERQYQETISYERKMARQLTRVAFEQEKILIMARRDYLSDEIARCKNKRANVEQTQVASERIEVMIRNMKEKLDSATNSDWRRILEAFGVRVLAFGDGTWDIEVTIATPSITNTTVKSSNLWAPPPT